MELVTRYSIYKDLLLMNLQEYIDFAKLCREIRVVKKLTQQQMAILLEVDLRTYKRYEAGEREPQGQVAWRLFIMKQEDKLISENRKS